MPAGRWKAGRELFYTPATNGLGGRMHARIGFVLGWCLAGWLASGCSQTASSCASSCPGCCDSTGTCLSGSVARACGVRGASCAVCQAGQSCTLGLCGSGSGGAGGSGGGSGGGAAGGGSGGGSGGGVAGGGSGGSGGGSGGSGGGSGGAGVQGTFPDLQGGTNGYRPQVAIDGAGVTHLVYTALTALGSTGVYPVRYGECAGNCGLAASWQFVTVADHLVLGTDARLALDASGRPRITFFAAGPNSGDPTTLNFATCDSGCAASAGNWQTVPVTTLAGNVSYVGADTCNFVVDSGGRPHLVYASYENFQNLLSYATCASGCAQAGNWTVTHIDTAHSGRPALAVTPSGGLRLVVTGADGVNDLSYRECDGACATASNWSPSTPLFWSASQRARVLSDAQGRLRLMWFQGVSGDPAGMATDRLALFGWCDGACTTATNWHAYTLGLPQDVGSDALDFALGATGTVAMVTVSADYAGKVTVGACTAGCATATPTWQFFSVEDDASVAAQTAPLPPTCTGGGPPLAFWDLGYEAKIALAPSGSGMLAYRAKTLQRCGAGNVFDGPSVIRSVLLP